MGDTKLLGRGKKKTLSSQTTTSWLLVGLTQLGYRVASIKKSTSPTSGREGQQ